MFCEKFTIIRHYTERSFLMKKWSRARLRYGIHFWWPQPRCQKSNFGNGGRLGFALPRRPLTEQVIFQRRQVRPGEPELFVNSLNQPDVAAGLNRTERQITAVRRGFGQVSVLAGFVQKGDLSVQRNVQKRTSGWGKIRGKEAAAISRPPKGQQLRPLREGNVTRQFLFELAHVDHRNRAPLTVSNPGTVWRKIPENVIWIVRLDAKDLSLRGGGRWVKRTEDYFSFRTFA